MAEIKTRDLVKGTIKAIDKASVAGERMKSAYISTKEKAEYSTHASENSVEEYAANRYENAANRITHEGAHQVDKLGRKSVQETKQNIIKAKDGIQHFKEKRAKQMMEKQMRNTVKTADRTASEATKRAAEKATTKEASAFTNKTVKRSSKHATDTTRPFRNQSVKVFDKPPKGIRQTARSTGTKSIKTTSKAAAKTAQKTVKTAEQTAKATIKTSQKVAQAAQKTAEATAKAAKVAAQAARAAAKAAVQASKVAVKVTIAAIKAIILAVKALVAAIAAGGWISVVVILVICLIGLVASSVFGIYFSGEESGTGQTMRTAVIEINSDYDNKLLEIQSGTTYDTLEMSGSRAVWKEVIAVYAVKTNTDSENPQEVATMDDTKKQLLKNIFWEMNEISSQTDVSTNAVITETDDGNGNIIQTETTESVTTLHITVSHKSAQEMAEQYGFNEEQKQYLAELLESKNNSLWAAVLYGIRYSDGQIVETALTQVGNVGGEPYWSWYGFNSRVEWCACFVSWCADQCGYIDDGVIPKFAGCVLGANWFKERDQWADRDYEPEPGTIIFFDWDRGGRNGPDGITDHVGIVQKVEDGLVYTVEGNSGNSCREQSYPVGYYEIYGYGIPAY